MQLEHLRAHRAFQRQDRRTEMRIDWCTTITKEQSRRHTTREIHRKINAKPPRRVEAGRTDTPEGQEDLRQFARIILQGHRIAHAGCGYRLPWRLRLRMIGARYPKLNEQQVMDIMALDEPGALMPKSAGFPPEINQQAAARRKLRELVRKQGANPAKHPDAFIMTAYLCRGCRNLIRQEAVQDGACPVCIMTPRERDMVEIACEGTDQIPVRPGRTPERQGWTPQTQTR